MLNIEIDKQRKIPSLNNFVEFTMYLIGKLYLRCDDSEEIHTTLTALEDITGRALQRFDPLWLYGKLSIEAQAKPNSITDNLLGVQIGQFKTWEEIPKEYIQGFAPECVEAVIRAELELRYPEHRIIPLPQRS